MQKEQKQTESVSFHSENFKRRSRYTVVFLGLLAAFFVIIVLNINTGNVHISVPKILRILFMRDGDAVEYSICLLYTSSYEHSHEYGMRSLAAYCNRVFGVSAEETEECYKRANKIMMGRIGSETAAIHNRLMRMQCMLELWDKPLFPHTVNMYDRY